MDPKQMSRYDLENELGKRGLTKEGKIGDLRARLLSDLGELFFFVVEKSDKKVN